jgi:uncharacterized DUF497 family protein
VAGTDFTVYTVIVRFRWDPRKARSNVAKHGVSFDVAITAFDDPFALVAPDDAHSTPEEPREWLIGQSDRGVLVVVFTKRANGEVYRIISARRASRQERQQYEDTRDFPI